MIKRDEKDEVVASYTYEHNDGDQIWNDETKFYKNQDGVYEKHFRSGYDGKIDVTIVSLERINKELDAIRASSLQYSNPKIRGGFSIQKDIEELPVEEMKHQSTSLISSSNGIKFEHPLFRISTIYDSSDFHHRYEYIFDDENELQKFANGELAKDRWGDTHTLSYYEFIDKAEITADIDVESLKYHKLKDENVYDFQGNIVQEQLENGGR